MMNQITEPPDSVGTFGQSFNYAVWTPNTQVELCNVPWNSDYRDLVKFGSQAALDAYLNTVAGSKVQINKMTLARAGDPVRINLPFAACYNFNYLRVNNNVSPITARYVDYAGDQQVVTDPGKTLYYFIQDVRYVAPNTTELVVLLDVWQTFGRDVSFGNCYIERGHVGIANSNQFQNQGRDYLTVPEGLDIGAEYNINDTSYLQIPDQKHFEDEHSNGWIVMGIGADVSVDPGDTSKPNLATAKGLSSSEGLPNGFELLYFKSSTDFSWFVSNFSETPWITQAIMFITLIPPIADDLDVDDNVFVARGVWNTTTKAVDTTKAFYLGANATIKIARVIKGAFRNEARNFIPARYALLKKFLTAPYMFIEMTTYNAAPLMLRPELIPSEDINVDIFQHSAPPSPRWAIVPQHYNASGTGGDVDDGEFLDFATFITNFPQFTVLNNNYLSYLASNKNSIAYGYSSADWSQQKALQGASYDMMNAQQSQATTSANAANTQYYNSQQTDIGNVSNVANAAIGAVTGPPNPVGIMGAAASTAIGVMGANAMNNSRNNAVGSAASVANQYTQSIADNNFNMANYAAKGDYQNAVNAVQARVQDAKMIQPSSVGQLGGESFIATVMGPQFNGFSNFDAHGGTGWRVYVKIKQINPGMMAIIGEYWLRYGYAVNRFGFMPASLQVMSKFTYWKLKETYISSSKCPEMFKQTIRGIFEKGVTVWSNPNDIGNIDMATNTPLPGVTY